MKALWIFFILVLFCIYILLGLHITDGLDSSIQIILSWVIYTILWTTFLNVFILGYFWSVVRDKKGPTGLRGPSGERGKVGIQGSCPIDATEAFLYNSLTAYIDSLYFSKTNTHIINDETKQFPCTYLNNKILVMSGSRQYKVIVANLSLENKPVISIVNYIKSIWVQWFELLYNSTSPLGKWFTDEFGDEDYIWSNNTNPFDEIKKYDIYYWGLTRDFRPLKAEICRSTNDYESSKFPVPNIALEPRLKIIDTNDYGFDANSRNSGYEKSNFWYPFKQTIGDDTYYPVGHIINNNWNETKLKTTIGSSIRENTFANWRNGPTMKTILVTGDVVKPVRFQHLRNYYWTGNWINTWRPICPTGYVSLGDVFKNRYTWNNSNFDDIRCVPEDCTEKTANTNIAGPWSGSDSYSLNRQGNNEEALPDNAYNLFKLLNTNFYKIKASCLTKPTKPISSTKDVEPEFADLGIGWYGHPYKLDPKYSIFSFLNLVPEGMLVNKATGRRFYIIHYGGEDINIYNVLDYNKNSNKYDNALEVNSDINSEEVSSKGLVKDKSNTNNKQKWRIVLENDKKFISLINLFNNKTLYLTLEPVQGFVIFKTINKNNLTQDQISNGDAIFSFISSFGPQLNILDPDSNNDNYSTSR